MSFNLDSINIFKKHEKSMFGWRLLFSLIVINIFILIFAKEHFIKVVIAFFKLFKRVFFYLILVWILMLILDLFVKNNAIIKHLGKDSGIKGWVFAILGGILSAGPIYAWYPLLSDLQEKGAKNSLIAAFLYNRAVKPALLPLMIGYFGLWFVVILTIVMIFMSIIDGLLVEKIIDFLNKKNKQKMEVS